MVKGQSVTHSIPSSSSAKPKKHGVVKPSDSPAVSTPMAASDVSQLNSAASNKNQYSAASCQSCGTVITKDVRALQCDNCQGTDSWKCAECLNLTNEVYDHLMKGSDLKWFCTNCDHPSAKRTKTRNWTKLQQC